MFNPRKVESDEEAGLAETLIEEPLEDEEVIRKDVEIRDSGTPDSSRGNIVVQRLGSIPSFNREIPVLRIISNDQASSSTSSSVIKDPESLVELTPMESTLHPTTPPLNTPAFPPPASAPSTAESVEIRAEKEPSGTAMEGITIDSDKPTTSRSLREEAELRQSTFRRPGDLTLPLSPENHLERSTTKLERDDESEDESPHQTAAEAAEVLDTPVLDSVIASTYGRAKARMQEPSPLTPAVKDQIADTLHLRRASMTHAPEDAVPEDGPPSATGKKPPTPKSFKQPTTPVPTTPLEKSPSIAADDDDPLEDSIIPQYKEKIKRDESLCWIISQWVCFILLVTLLICSVNIKIVRDITWFGDNIWRWQAVALVIFSGRLIAGWIVQLFVLLIEKRFLLRKRVLYFVFGLRKSVKNCIWLALVITVWETVFLDNDHSHALRVITKLLWCIFTVCVSWMLKVLTVKVAANGFHRSAYFDRIQDCLFNQFLLATLSAPPTIYMSDSGPTTTTSATNPNQFSNQQQHDDTTIEEAARLARRLSNTPVIARSPNPIEQDKLQQLTSQNVSAWTLKSLMKGIRKNNLSSYSSTFSEKAEWEIDSEVRAKTAAKQIFYNIARPGKKYLLFKDFLYFLPENKATRAFSLFETTESGTITKKAFVKWVVTVYKERRALALTLNDNKTVVAKLNKVLDMVLAIALIIVSLLILGIEVSRLLVFFSSIFIPCVFVFGNAAKTTFEALLFLFVLHPYDVGDRVAVDGTMMLVEEMNVLNTVFLGPTNEKIYYPNAMLGLKSITNYYRSPDQWDGIDFQIHMNTPLEKLGVLKERMQRYIDSQPQFWYPDFGLMCKDIDDCNKMKMGYYFQHHLNYHEAGERFKRRSNMMLYMKQQLEDLGITYQLPSQEVIVTGIPAFSFPIQQGKSSSSSPSPKSSPSFVP